jgi:negative regulator of sigma E activity
MNYDDETLMAYADGELDEARRAEIAAALEKDPELARRVARHRALRDEVAGAYSGVLDQGVPDALRAAARGGATPTTGKSGNVVPFPARATRPPPTPWRAREWVAMAASLVLGVMLSWRFLAPGGDIGSQEGALVARGELAKALDTQLASTQTATAPVALGVTFKGAGGDYCRSFVMRETATAGLACRRDGQWHIPVTTSVELAGGDIRQATTAMPPAILAAIEARLSGEVLDATGELQARDARWE